MDFTVEHIEYDKCKDWLLYKHYAKRIPSISYSYGLYDDKELVGICTYGKPSSNTLRIGVCGKEYSEYVYELNRLIVNDNMPKNIHSFFIAKTFKLLPSPLILVSYADTSKNHHGYIYQATNWIYTGLSAKRTDWKVKGMEQLHGQTIADLSRGHKDRAKYMRDRFGDNFYLEDRPRKHRYIYFLGNKYEKKNFKNNLLYKIEQYPKGDNIKYDASYKPIIQEKLF